METAQKIQEILEKEYDLILNMDSEYFAEIFNTISDVVSTKEMNKNKNVNPEYINDKILKEVTSFLIKKKDEMLSNGVIIPRIIPKQELLVTKLEPVLFHKIIYMDTPKIDINLDIKDLRIKQLYIEDPENTLITENNNTLVIVEQLPGKKELFTEEKIITIEPGNYDFESFINELTFKFTLEKLTHKYRFYTDNITRKFCITTMEGTFSPNISVIRNLNTEIPACFNIIKEKSTLLGVLGFTQDQELDGKDKYISNNYLNLRKQDILHINIQLNEESLDDRDMHFILERNMQGGFKCKEVAKIFTPYEYIKTLEIHTGIPFTVRCVLEILYYVK